MKHRLPTISDMGDFAALGGLMCYGFKFADNQRSAAEIVDKICAERRLGTSPFNNPRPAQAMACFTRAGSKGSARSRLPVALAIALAMAAAVGPCEPSPTPRER